MCRTKFTTKKRERFIEHLAEHGNVTKAADYACVSRRTAYDHRNEDPVFAAEWDEAADRYTEKLEAEADRRAVEGTEKPVFYKGEECGAIREYSDTLLIFRLKALKPDKYRDNAKVDMEHSGEVTLTVKYDEPLGEDEPAGE